MIDILSIFLSKSRYFFIRKITDFVNNLLEKYLFVIPRFFFFLDGRRMINRTNSETRRIGKRVALTRSILRRFNWRRTPETTIKINCSNNGDLVADESAYRSTIETRD